MDLAWPLNKVPLEVFSGHLASRRASLHAGIVAERIRYRKEFVMSILEERLPYIESLKLGHGSHPAPSNGLVEACVMEAVSYVAGEPWSAAPECASPVITAFLVSWNDSLPDEDRQMLKPYIPRIVGTRTSKKDEETRAWMMTDWLARECAPAWLRLAGLTGQAEALEALGPLTSAAKARKAQPTLDQAKTDSAAASAAAGNAAWAASWDASGAAAWAASWDASGAAAWAASWAAAGAAAWDAAGAAAGAAASAAAGAALQPTVKGLQASALLLLDRMIEVGKK